MGSPFAIAAVTAVLKRLLENGLVDSGVPASVGGDVIVTAIPPDRVVTGGEERPQLNLFLFQVTPNASLRGRSGALALDLHYLIAAYGAQDLHVDILLGYALQELQRHGTIEADALRSILGEAPVDAGGHLAAALSAISAAPPAFVDRLNLSPQFLSAEELSRLWSALQARYRPSAIYRASAALIA